MIRLESVPSRLALLTQLGWFGLWAAVTLIALWLQPSPAGHGTHMQLGLPPCPSMFFFEKPCFGCGLTTSFSALVHGDFSSAFHAHALGPAVYLLFTISAFAALGATALRRKLHTNTRGFNTTLAVFIVVFAAYGVVRFFGLS